MAKKALSKKRLRKRNKQKVVEAKNTVHNKNKEVIEEEISDKGSVDKNEEEEEDGLVIAENSKNSKDGKNEKLNEKGEDDDLIVKDDNIADVLEDYVLNDINNNINLFGNKKSEEDECRAMANEDFDGAVFDVGVDDGGGQNDLYEYNMNMVNNDKENNNNLVVRVTKDDENEDFLCSVSGCYNKVFIWCPFLQCFLCHFHRNRQGNTPVKPVKYCLRSFVQPNHTDAFLKTGDTFHYGNNIEEVIKDDSVLLLTDTTVVATVRSIADPDVKDSDVNKDGNPENVSKTTTSCLFSLLQGLIAHIVITVCLAEVTQSEPVDFTIVLDISETKKDNNNILLRRRPKRTSLLSKLYYFSGTVSVFMLLLYSYHLREKRTVGSSVMCSQTYLSNPLSGEIKNSSSRKSQKIRVQRRSNCSNQQLNSDKIFGEIKSGNAFAKINRTVDKAKTAMVLHQALLLYLCCQREKEEIARSSFNNSEASLCQTDRIAPISYSVILLHQGIRKEPTTPNLQFTSNLSSYQILYNANIEKITKTEKKLLRISSAVGKAKNAMVLYQASSSREDRLLKRYHQLHQSIIKAYWAKNNGKSIYAYDYSLQYLKSLSVRETKLNSKYALTILNNFHSLAVVPFRPPVLTSVVLQNPYGENHRCELWEIIVVVKNIRGLKYFKSLPSIHLEEKTVISNRSEGQNNNHPSSGNQYSPTAFTYPNLGPYYWRSPPYKSYYIIPTIVSQKDPPKMEPYEFKDSETITAISKYNSFHFCWATLIGDPYVDEGLFNKDDAIHIFIVIICIFLATTVTSAMLQIVWMLQKELSRVNKRDRNESDDLSKYYPDEDIVPFHDKINITTAEK